MSIGGKGTGNVGGPEMSEEESSPERRIHRKERREKRRHSSKKAEGICLQVGLTKNIGGHAGPHTRILTRLDRGFRLHILLDRPATETVS